MKKVNEERNLSVEDIVEAYAEETSNWDFFSDPQRMYISDGYIVACLRDYNWYITKEKIKTPLEAVKAIFEIDWICEYDEDSEDDGFKNIKCSKFWKEG